MGARASDPEGKARGVGPAGTASFVKPATKPVVKARRPTSEKQDESYENRRKATFKSASAAAASLKKKPKTAYSLAKETRRLAAQPNSTVRPVSANAIRNSDLCRPLLDPERNAVVLSRDPRAFPDELMRMDKHQLVQQVLDERAWAVNESERRMALEIELGRKVLEARERRRLGLEEPEPAG